MDRRSFFKVIGTASGGAVTGACGNQAREVIPLLVPEKQIIPGAEQWRPGVCRECGAGCGIIFRMMEAEREIESGDQRVRRRIAAIKKVEGNPLDPVSGGRLCARGQAGVQRLYHPDRLRGPMKRSGEKGTAAFEEISWEKAIEEVTALVRDVSDPARVLFLTRPHAGRRSNAIASFLKGINAPPAATAGLLDFAIEHRAAEYLFGWSGPPVFEIQEADFVLGIGADFLGGWMSPVFYSRRYGQMRQGRPATRGRLFHAESRLSLTAGAADRWLPVKPGGEQAFALAIGHSLVQDGLSSGGSEALQRAFASVDLPYAARVCGLAEEELRRVARELGESEAPVVVGGASITHANSFAAVVTANALNLLLDNIGKRVMPPASSPIDGYAATRPIGGASGDRLRSAELILLDGVNPAYTRPDAAAALRDAPSVVSFSTILDDSSVFADLILPDHDSLESAEVVVPMVSPVPALTGGPAWVRPLHNTRALESVLAAVAEALETPVKIDSPEEAFRRVPAAASEDPEEVAAYSVRAGGWWGERESVPAALRDASLPPLGDPDYRGDAGTYPLHFQAYPSVQFGDGSGAALPWMQELPDPVSSAMWGLPVEIDPATAAGLGVRNGDAVTVVSPHGRLDAPAYVHPAAIPGVVSMAIGQGHRHLGRYASERGANPLSLVGQTFEEKSGALVYGATRVRLEKAARAARLVQFATVDREPDIPRR